MSKLGNKANLIPKETTVKVEGGRLILSGPKGKRELNINDKNSTKKGNDITWGGKSPSVKLKKGNSVIV